MSQNSLTPSETPALGADSPPPSHARSGRLSVPPALLSRVGKCALMLGGLCAIIGGVEGALAGSLLAPAKDHGALILAVAVDRGILLGLIGTGIGAAIGVLDWRVGSRKKKGQG
jgi:hypothetical protein